MGIVGAGRSQRARNGHGLVRQIILDQGIGQDVLIIWIIGLNGIQSARRRDGLGTMACFQERQAELLQDFRTIPLNVIRAAQEINHLVPLIQLCCELGGIEEQIEGVGL